MPFVLLRVLSTSLGTASFNDWGSCLCHSSQQYAVWFSSQSFECWWPMAEWPGAVRSASVVDPAGLHWTHHPPSLVFVLRSQRGSRRHVLISRVRVGTPGWWHHAPCRFQKVPAAVGQQTTAPAPVQRSARHVCPRGCCSHSNSAGATYVSLCRAPGFYRFFVKEICLTCIPFDFPRVRRNARLLGYVCQRRVQVALWYYSESSQKLPAH